MSLVTVGYSLNWISSLITFQSSNNEKKKNNQDFMFKIKFINVIWGKSYL